MTLSTWLRRVGRQSEINFLLTNRIPRRLLTRFIGWLSKIENPLVRDISIAMWRLFSDLDLSDAKHTRFRSMHDCFIRELKAGARPIDNRADIVVSPCDAIVGAHGRIDDTTLIQAKGHRYTLEELFADPGWVNRYRHGVYVTLRLTAGMYHRFHAPYACRVRRLNYIAGDAWNVNPAALRRVEKLFCKNERAVLDTVLAPSGHPLALVPVAAVLVASIRVHFLDVLLHLKYRGPHLFECNHAFAKGEELGWFEHGSTIIVIGSQAMSVCHSMQPGSRVRMGEALLCLPGHAGKHERPTAGDRASAADK